MKNGEWTGFESLWCIIGITHFVRVDAGVNPLLQSGHGLTVGFR